MEPGVRLALLALGNRLIKKFHIFFIKGPTSCKTQFESHLSDAVEDFSSVCYITDTSQFFSASRKKLCNSGNDKNACFFMFFNGLLVLHSFHARCRHCWLSVCQTQLHWMTLFTSYPWPNSLLNVLRWEVKTSAAWSIFLIFHTCANASFKHQAFFFSTEGVVWQKAVTLLASRCQNGLIFPGSMLDSRLVYDSVQRSWSVWGWVGWWGGGWVQNTEKRAFKALISFKGFKFRQAFLFSFFFFPFCCSHYKSTSKGSPPLTICCIVS